MDSFAQVNRSGLFGQNGAISALGYGVIGNKQLHGALRPTERRGSLEWSLFCPGYVVDEAGGFAGGPAILESGYGMTELGPRRSRSCRLNTRTRSKEMALCRVW
jgi:hypothetical protein